MGDIKPIETCYNGNRFRSRLEAKWAYFFDLISLKYIYEHKGFSLSSGGSYLPDFFLPELNAYVEIKYKDYFKRNTDEGCAHCNKYRQIAIDFVEHDICSMFLTIDGDPYDYVMYTYYKTTASSQVTQKGLNWESGDCYLILSAITQFGESVWPFLFPDVCTTSKVQIFSVRPNESYTRSLKFGEYDSDLALSHYGDLTFFDSCNWGEDSGLQANLFREEGLKARQARFEHGETPSVKYAGIPINIVE